MATSDDNDEKKDDAETGGGEDSSNEALANVSDSTAIEAQGSEVVDGEVEPIGDVASTLGSERYVHATFFVAGIIAAYLFSKVLVLGWNSLAGWPAAVRAVPQLVSYGEEERDSVALIAGAVVGTLAVVQSYRKEGVRTWANEVATELSKVTWPTREAVLNGTVVVVVASVLGTVYIAVLDRIWGFLTTLVYGA